MTDKKFEDYMEKLWEEYKEGAGFVEKPTDLVCSMSLLTDLHRHAEDLDAVMVDEDFGNLCEGIKTPDGKTTDGVVRLWWNGCDCKEYAHVFIGRI